MQQTVEKFKPKFSSFMRQWWTLRRKVKIRLSWRLVHRREPGNKKARGALMGWEHETATQKSLCQMSHINAYIWNPEKRHR